MIDREELTSACTLARKLFPDARDVRPVWSGTAGGCAEVWDGEGRARTLSLVTLQRHARERSEA